MATRRELIITPNGVVHSERPETDKLVLREMEGGMNNIAASHATNRLDGPLGNTILKLGPNSTTFELLLQFLTMLSIFFGTENAVVGVISANTDIDVGSFLFEDQFASYGLSSIELALGMMKDIATGVVNIDSSAGVAMAARAMARVSSDTARDTRDVMITTNAIARLNIVLFDDFKTRWRTR